MAGRESTEHFALGSKIAVEAMKSLLLVNGGAATALVALTSKAPAGPNYGMPVLVFGCAALLNATTLAVGYFSQLAYANHVLAIEKLEGATIQAQIEVIGRDATSQIERHGRLQRVAIGLVFSSLVFSVIGMATAFMEVR